MDILGCFHFLGHMATLFLIFWRTARLLSKVAIPFYIPTSSVRRFHFLHILTNPCLLYIFSHYIYSSVCEVVSYFGFNLHPTGLWYWASFLLHLLLLLLFSFSLFLMVLESNSGLFTLSKFTIPEPYPQPSWASFYMLSTICIPIWETFIQIFCLFKFFPPFLSCVCFFYILDISPLSDM